MRTAHDIAFLDEELAELAGTATDLLGEDAVSEAFECTFTRCHLAARDQPITLEAYRDAALKPELRRIVGPQ